MNFIGNEVLQRVEAEHALVIRALHSLKEHNPHWESNLNAFRRMNPYARYQWYERMKSQAEKGLPTARILIGEVITQRLK